MTRPNTVKRFKLELLFELLDRSALLSDERDAVEAALEEQRKSTNPKWRVGAAALAHTGEIVAVHNHTVGPTKHAEQICISEFYRQVQNGKLRALVVVGAQGDSPVISRDTPYPDDVELDQVQPSIWMCGKCLEFVHDCTVNVPKVDVLLVCPTGQVLKTTLRALFPKPHTSSVVPLKWENGVCFPVPSTEEHKDNANCNGH
jgi:cytidine deaminase